MASNTAPSLGIELRHIEHSHGTPRSGFSKELPANWGLDGTAPPFTQLLARHGRPLKIAILSDFTRISYANGAAFQTRFLYQELQKCGHQVSIIGPKDPNAKPEDLAPGTIELPSVPLKMYPGLYLPLPLESWVFDASRWDFDLVFAQTTSLLLEFGVWLRKMRGIPLLSVNTTHLAAAYEVLLPEHLAKLEVLRTGVEFTLKKPYERLFSRIYNESDALIVLSEGLRTYWRERGVTVPIHVVPRAVQPEVFGKPSGQDPYLDLLGDKQDGPRFICAGRHTREKSQDRLIRIFAEHILSAEPKATLTLVGLGPDTHYFKFVAKQFGVQDRVFFAGEVPFTRMVDYYAFADVFLHASLSETYGNVLGEALWCGTPTVAFADGMGASSQIRDGVNGILLSAGKGQGDYHSADLSFGKAAVELVRDSELRAKLGLAAAKLARERSSPMAVQAKLTEAFFNAQDHAKRCGLRPGIERPAAYKWVTTFQHFRPWSMYTAGLYFAGHFRPAHEANEALHPQIHTTHSETKR